MKIIRCPSCGKVHLNQKYCTACGCYLPPVLEEEEDMARVYFSEPLFSPNEMRAALYADNMPIMSVADSIKQAEKNQLYALNTALAQAQTQISQNMQTLYIMRQSFPKAQDITR